MPTKRRTKEKLAVALPSRGLVFSKTVEELLDELRDYDHQIFWSHGRPIPDCFEIPTRQALGDNTFTHLLVIEEDMVIPKGAIAEMLKEKRPVVAYDYPATDVPSGTVLYESPQYAYFTGVGVFLIEMDIVRRMVFPIWRTNISWSMMHRNGYVEFNISEREADYGQQDIAFCLRLYVNEIPIYVMPESTGQRKLVKKGEGMTNHGTHEIKEFFEINTERPELAPQDNGFLVIKVQDEIYSMYKPAAEKLIAEGRAERITIGRAEFHNLDSIKDWVWLKSI
jgi:hypothetical protein